ncbi:MAG: tRNA uridine-5-carboxymethylaminomethyl(34) synthesis GTPase MnmE [Gammaproteobacteria bacterium]|nr:tRNA uridine-5-carboxymethylaminomethyl(34) synthesis GTPase MnmE [Gammaproteobacteria bacterium]MDP2348870.1 tRNA uridine-5-carboxymethylaminomethyl(34) synthesis GTPase MnmE [Gammaproteobacteria bacterium]
MSLSTDSDTICAIATPPGRSGVGIVRVSGTLCRDIAQQILHFLPTPRHAHYTDFFAIDAEVIDQGLALFFPSPNSFTGEDVLELQGHGGYFILDRLLREVLKTGARIALPGEFSERAFINDKMDLAQAEAIADLIEASSEEAARSALRTLQGDFSKLINSLSISIIELRVYIEAAIDFSEEEIDFLTEGKTTESLRDIINQVDSVLAQAKQGAILREGMSVVIAGKPNAGKSSLLNALAGKDAAIVTEIAGTTRDTLVERINIDGMPLHITDTAGLRESDDVVEKEGIRRALHAIESADRILLVVDSSEDVVTSDNLFDYLTSIGLQSLTSSIAQDRVTVINNKIDLVNGTEGLQKGIDRKGNTVASINISARHNKGVDLLRQHLKDCMGYQPAGEGGFIARRRHLDALEKARSCLLQAQRQLTDSRASELVAEDLKHAHRYLGEITGEFTTDDLLGRIFSSFCVGK